MGTDLSRLLTVVAMVIGIASGFAVYRWQLVHVDPPPPELVTVNQAGVEVGPGTIRPEFTLSDLDGNPQAVSTWDGTVLVINFWATWCGPCRHEIPFFIELQSRYAERGLQVLGVALDMPSNVSPYYHEMGMNYPTLWGQADTISVGEAYGNKVGGLPYTVFIDREGKIVRIKNGPLELDEMIAVVEPLL